MDRNLKLICRELLSIFILINILFLIILSLKFPFNLKLAILDLLKFNLTVSFLIIIHILFRLSKERNKIYCLYINWIHMPTLILRN